VILDYPAPLIKVYSLESAIAEKFEAIVRLNVATSRMKDFYDLVYLAQHHIFKSDILAEAIDQTFQTRGTAIEDRKIVWSKEFKQDIQRGKQWTAFHTTNKLPMVGTLEIIVGILENFLEPILLDDGKLSMWLPGKLEWQKKR